MTPEDHKDVPFSDEVLADYLRGWLAPEEAEPIRQRCERDSEFAAYLNLMATWAARPEFADKAAVNQAIEAADNKLAPILCQLF